MRSHPLQSALFLLTGGANIPLLRVVVAVTLVVGTTLLGFSLATTPGDSAFYAFTFALAATWTAEASVSEWLMTVRSVENLPSPMPYTTTGPPPVFPMTRSAFSSACPSRYRCAIAPGEAVPL